MNDDADWTGLGPGWEELLWLLIDVKTQFIMSRAIFGQAIEASKA